MADPDDHTLVGDASWQQYGSQEPTTLPQSSILDPQTARAFRAACWAACIAIWFGIAITAVILAGLVVGIFGNPPVP